MKTMKKTLALALVLIMMLSLATVAYADDATYTLTITNATKGHTFNAYQIFKGVYTAPEAGYTVGTLTNVEWGASVTNVDNEGKLVTTNTNLNGLTAEDVAERMSTSYVGTTEAPAIRLEDLLAAVALKAEAYKSSGNYNETDKTYTISGLEAGYYVVKDSFTPGSVVAEGDTLSTTIVQVMGNETMDPKSSAPKSEKKIRDTNDSTNSNNGWEDSADYDIGDEVPFRITFTLPSNYEEYEAYQVIVHDHQEAGLTFNADTVQVFALHDGEYYDITDAFSVATGNNVNDDCTFHISCSDITKIAFTKDGKSVSLANGDEISFRYTSTLNENAKIGVDGNLNTSHVQFSNNPEGDGTETNTTPDDTVIAFTYKVIVNKVDTAGNPLAGADFTLYKFVRNENGGGVEYKVDGNVYTGSWVEVSKVTPGATDTTFTFTGLDDGYYKLVESKTPTGYNTIDDVTFTVEASHVAEMNIDAENRDEVLTELTGNVVTGELTFTASLTNCSLSTDVVNAKGTILPETGGIGTTVFYAIGGLLVVAAVVMLITKKRMAAMN